TVLPQLQRSTSPPGARLVENDRLRRMLPCDDGVPFRVAPHESESALRDNSVKPRHIRHRIRFVLKPDVEQVSVTRTGLVPARAHPLYLQTLGRGVRHNLDPVVGEALVPGRVELAELIGNEPELVF